MSRRPRGRRAAARRARAARELEVAAANVVNATGVWADRLRPERAARRGRGAGHPPQPRHAHHRPGGRAAARGGRDRARGRRPHDLRAAVAGPDADRHHRQRLRGRARARPARPTRTSTTCSRRSTPSSRTDLGPGDVAGAYAGVRPLISTGDPKKSVDISRKAELYETSSGMVTITGGKLTTWRRMAKMTVDRIVERDGRDAPCRTHQIPLGMAVDAGDLPRVAGVAAGCLRAARRPLRLRGARGAADRGRAAGAGGADRRRAAPTCSPRPSTPRGASRRARSATRCCGAPGSG